VTFEPGHIDGVIIRDLVRHTDKRGWLMELYRSDQVDATSLPAMAYISATEPGATRGPHEHLDQADYFCFIGPSMFRIYLWDNRISSPTYGKRMVFEAGQERALMLTIPPGVVHAYKNIGTVPGWSINLPNRLYGGVGRKEKVDEVRYEDKSNSQFELD
jgi:dTDP-4-dehydrorhamnose 3,5-epimerase